MRIFPARVRFAVKATGPILAVGLGSAGAQTVPVNDRHTLAIASQPLPQALAELSSTTGLRVFYESEAPYEHISKPLQGNFTTDEALRILLSGTGISARQVAENAVTLDFVATTAEDI
ncbi:MAG: STN domain-containing protein, partial [Pseudomonadota bacterium]